MIAIVRAYCCCQVEVLSVAECVSAYPNIVTNDRVLCARGEAVDDEPQSRSSLLADACQVRQTSHDDDHFIIVTQGDSGGPLVMEDGQSGLFTLIGVVTGERLENSIFVVTQQTFSRRRWLR